MTDPRYQIDCPTCLGTNRVGEIQCPVPANLEPDCDLCTLKCNDGSVCPDCENGSVAEYEYRKIIKANQY